MTLSIISLREKALEAPGIVHEIQIGDGYSIGAFLSKGKQIARIELSHTDHYPRYDLFQAFAAMWGFPLLKGERIFSDWKFRLIATWTKQNAPVVDENEINKIYAEARIMSILGDNDKASELRDKAEALYLERIETYGKYTDDGETVTTDGHQGPSESRIPE